MKPRFSEDKFRPFIVKLFKTFRQFGVKSAVRNGDGRLYKEPVIKKFDMIPGSVGIEELETIVNIFTRFINKTLDSRHYIQFRI